MPVDADLRHYPDMPLEVARLQGQRHHAGRRRGLPLCRAAVVRELASGAWRARWPMTTPHCAGWSASVVTFGRGAGSGTGRFVAGARFADGRLYHRVVCEKVVAGLNSTANYEWGKACARVRKENLRRRKAKMEMLAMPEKPKELVLAWPVPVTEREPEVAAHVPEREFSSERKGKDYFPRASSTDAPREQRLTKSKGRSRAPDGAGHDGVHELLGKAVASARMPA